MEGPKQCYRSRTKYFIDYENEIRECGNCREVLPFSAFSPFMGRADGKKTKGIIRTHCKPCRSLITHNSLQMKKAARIPHFYKNCADCGRIYIKGRKRPCKCGCNEWEDYSV